MGRELKCRDMLFPEEEVLDRIKLGGYGRPVEVALTDRRVIVAGPTGALGSHFTLVRGDMAAGFPLSEFQSFVIGVGKRPMLFLSSITLAVGGGIMLSHDVTRYPGLVLLGMALAFLLAWSAWRKTFVEITAGGLKIAGRAPDCEARVFLERLQLAAEKARKGASPLEIREAVKFSGLTPEMCREALASEAGQSAPGEESAQNDSAAAANGEPRA